MKNKRTYLLCFIASAILLIVSITVLIVNTTSKLSQNTIRYSSPEEAFEKSDINGEIIDITYDGNAALIIYKYEDGSYSNQILCEDDNGWTSMDVDYRHEKTKTLNYGFVYYMEFNGKGVIKIALSNKVNEKIPQVSDSFNSEFVYCSYPEELGYECIFGLKSFDEKLTDDYMISINDEHIYLKDLSIFG